MVGLNNAIKLIYVLIPLKAVDCKTTSKARNYEQRAEKFRPTPLKVKLVGIN